jgi:hypothetical protein
MKECKSRGWPSDGIARERSGIEITATERSSAWC